MQYPRPDDRAHREWRDVVGTLAEQLGCTRAILRAACPTTLEILALATAGASFGDGDGDGEGRRTHRDGSALSEAVLERREPLAVGDTGREAQWDAAPERREGVQAYLGALLSWPDGEPFGVLEAHFTETLDEARIASCMRLVQTLALTINLRLELLYRDDRAHFDATHDALTGLANRRMFDELAGYQIERSKRNGGELWMLVWEIDHYDAISAQLGSQTALTVLRAAAERARSCIRRSDVLARVEDNQFAVLLSEANEFVATAVSDRIRRNAHRIQPLADNPRGLGLSCGVTPYVPGEQLTDWRQRAEQALRTAREEGGDQLVALHPTESD